MVRLVLWNNNGPVNDSSRGPNDVPQTLQIFPLKSSISFHAGGKRLTKMQLYSSMTMLCIEEQLTPIQQQQAQQACV
jgi:hypothetical protein